MNKQSYVKYLPFAIVLAVFALIPGVISEYYLATLFLFFIYVILAESWNLLAGYSGLFSLAQSAFMGVSGYAVAILTSYYGVNLWVSLAIALCIVAVMSLLMSLFIFRVKGIYFGIMTMLIANTLMYLFSNWSYVNYSSGMFIKSENYPGTTTLYYVALVMAVLTIFIILKVLRSGFGLGLMAMRDDEEVARSVGVDIFKTKLLCWFTGALLSGLGGGLFYISNIYIMAVDAFSIQWSVKFVFIVTIGGMGTLIGPVIGAFLWTFLSLWLNAYPFASQFILGAFAILVMLVSPKGIAGELEKRFKINFNFLSSNRTLIRIPLEN